MENRRAFLRLAVFGLASSTVGARAALAGVQPAPAVGALPSTDASRAAPWWLLHPLAPDAELGLGWRILMLYPAVQGAVTVNLGHEDGRVARVDVCLREGAPRGPAATESLDFIVMDGGDGSAPMDESLGRVVRRLAAIVGCNEDRSPDALAALEPHADRIWRHADALATAATRLTPG